MQRKAATLLIVFVAILHAIAISLVAQDQPSATGDEDSPSQRELLQRCLDAWRRRQETITTLRCAWNEQRTFPQGSFVTPAMAVESELTQELQQTGVPKIDQQFDAAARLLLFGAWMRYESSIMRQREDVIELEDYTSSYDGDSSRLLFSPRSAQNQPRGGIRKRAANDDVANVHLKPLMMFARPLAPVFLQFADIELNVEDEGIEVDGHQCVLLSYGRNRIGVDPNCDFVVRQWSAVTRRGKLQMQVRINYTADDVLAWRPTDWSVVEAMKDPGNLTRAVKTTSVIESFKLNSPILNDEFRLEFPADAEVYDDRSERFISKSKLEMPSTATGQADSSRGISKMLVVVLNVLIMTVLLAWFAIKRRRRP